MLTVALALLIGLILVVGVDVFSLSDPVQVALQVLLQLLLLTQLLEVSTSFSLLSLLGKLSGFVRNTRGQNTQTHTNTQECINDQKIHARREIITFTANKKKSFSQKLQIIFNEWTFENILFTYLLCIILILIVFYMFTHFNHNLSVPCVFL